MISSKRYNPKQVLNKAFLKVKPNRAAIELFKSNLILLLDRANETESEEFHKNLLSDFLKETWYKPLHFINTKGRNDLVIHNGDHASASVGVIIETKKPGNKAEMPRFNDVSNCNLNVKGFHELVLYYLRERITHHNLEIKHLIVTDIYEWYVFDVIQFERLFAQDKELVKKFLDFESGRLSDTKTDFFYSQVASPFISSLHSEIEYAYFDLHNYLKPLRNSDRSDDHLLIGLFKLLSPEHLLKLPFANDSNTLDKRFYSELLHIIGLTETKDGGRKLIQRHKKGARHAGSVLEDAINQLDALDKITRLPKPEQYGNSVEDRYFNVALELSITWINRILFIKLLEAQLLTYHKGDSSFAFLNPRQIKDYDRLNTLFFQALARPFQDRSSDVKSCFDKVPYLNSSLFEPTELEQITLFVSNLSGDKPVPIFHQTVLKDAQGRQRTGQLPALEYLLLFLDAYDFGSEGVIDIQEENKTLINASVLGLIFEKINGYKDGSFFTPGFITMYMCRETIRRAVVRKFNEVKGWHCTTLDELYDKIENRDEANTVINSITICDPAVGSGHFLVSALNEMIAVKHDLRILQDRNGRRLKEYDVVVENDELVVTDENGDPFAYHPQNKESQRVQEALFHEKQTIIENCLFGVDINSNSVKICRLRLWIELLKNSYYKNASELETLPNIDINIKCGNSLVSRFALDADLSKTLKKSKWSIESYRVAVATYRNATVKEEKRAMERLIHDIKTDFESEISVNDPRLKRLRKVNGELDFMTNQTQLFEMTKKEKADFDRKASRLADEIQKIEAELEEIRSNRIYQNAFEWRFEFPEVLDENGTFTGFDVVIGNPPYIRQEAFAELKPYLKARFNVFVSTADLLTYFVELGFHLMKDQGHFTFIISNKFSRAEYGKNLRMFLLHNTALTHYVDFSSIPVFDEATVDAAILGFEKRTGIGNRFLYVSVDKETIEVKNFSQYAQSIQQSIEQQSLSDNLWGFENPDVLKIKLKVESQGVPLKDWSLTINYGIKTGLNEAFVVDGNTRLYILIDEPQSEKFFKPLLRGRDIRKWMPDFQDLWLIFIPKGYTIKSKLELPNAMVFEPTPRYGFIELDEAWDWFSWHHPKIAGHLLPYRASANRRSDMGDYWWEQRACAYQSDFSQPKIIYPNMTKFLPFVMDINEHYFHNDKSFHLISDRNFWLVAFFNSRLFDYCFRDSFPELLGGTRELRKVFFDKIPVKQISSSEEDPFKKRVLQILETKSTNPTADTTPLEAEIDRLVYNLYGLTEEEIKIVEIV